MEWGTIATIVLALLFAVGFPLALRSRSRGGPQKLEELRQHLEGMGVTTSPLDEGSAKSKAGKRRGRGEASPGAIRLSRWNIDSIRVVGVASQYGVNYFLDYLVNNPSLAFMEKKKKTSMAVKKDARIRGKVVNIEWRGDPSLAQRLNLDHRLRERLLQVDLASLKGGINVLPEQKHGHVRIRTSYHLPSPQLLNAIDIIAQHVSSVW